MGATWRLTAVDTGAGPAGISSCCSRCTSAGSASKASNRNGIRPVKISTMSLASCSSNDITVTDQWGMVHAALLHPETSV